jgi:hypothetical protein
MEEKEERPNPHPDDLMAVTVALNFQAKLNPDVHDAPPFEIKEFETTFGAEEAADYLEALVRAIREKRLYSFMIQEFAESAVSAGDWIAQTTREILAEARADIERTEKKAPPDGGEEGER